MKVSLVLCGFAMVGVLANGAWAAPAANKVTKNKTVVEQKAAEVKAPEVKAPEAVQAPQVEQSVPSVLADTTEQYGPKGLIPGGFLVGPKVSVGVHPTPALFGLEAKWNNLVGFGIDYGYFPSLTLDSVSVGFKSISGTVRLFPWSKAMFIGVSMGSQTFNASQTETVGVTPVTVDLEVQTTFLAPHIGWRWMWSSGFFWGMELGWQLALSNSTTLTAPSAALATTIKEVNDAGDELGKASLPRIALIQLGWMF